MTDKLTNILKEGIKQSKEIISLIENESKRLNSFKKGDTVLLDSKQKVIYIEDLQKDDVMLRHIAGYKFIVNKNRISSL
tara:strand:- start:8 stop:244 length:237 start_codon:yes stop_codon:yes gene_type:complete